MLCEAIVLCIGDKDSKIFDKEMLESQLYLTPDEPEISLKKAI